MGDSRSEIKNCAQHRATAEKPPGGGVGFRSEGRVPGPPVESSRMAVVQSVKSGGRKHVDTLTSLSESILGG